MGEDDHAHGLILFYDASDLSLIYTLESDEKMHTEIGGHILYTNNLHHKVPMYSPQWWYEQEGYIECPANAPCNTNRHETVPSEEWWYNSYDIEYPEYVTLNSITLFINVDEKWGLVKTEDLMIVDVFPVGQIIDYPVISSIGDSILYKSLRDDSLRTFMSCGYNYVYNEEDEDRDYDHNFNYTYRLAYRNCTPCPESMPFSLGYNSDECKTCANYAGAVQYMDDYIQYFFS